MPKYKVGILARGRGYRSILTNAPAGGKSSLMTDRIPGTFYKSKNFLHCHKCGKRTMWRRYSTGFRTDRQGNRSAVVIAMPYCKAHSEIKKGARG